MRTLYDVPYKIALPCKVGKRGQYYVKALVVDLRSHRWVNIGYKLRKADAIAVCNESDYKAAVLKHSDDSIIYRNQHRGWKDDEPGRIRRHNGEN